MKHKRLLRLACWATAACGLASASAYAELAANISLTSDYVWRGVSQTLRDPAIQGGFDYYHESGAYVGVWGSNVDFFDNNAPGADPADDDRAGIEMDYYAGYGREYESGFAWDFSLIVYQFPDSEIDTTTEAVLNAGYGKFSTSLARNFDSKSWYTALGVEHETSNGFVFSGSIGRHTLDDDVSYTDFRAAAGFDIAGTQIEFAYTATDLSAAECVEFAGRDDLCDGTLVLTLYREF